VKKVTTEKKSVRRPIKQIKQKISGGHCYYIRAKDTSVYHFFLWDFEYTKNLGEESHPDNTGKRLSVLRVGGLGLLYKIRKYLANCYINGKYYYSYAEAITIFVRRSPNEPLQPWPAPRKKRKRH